ncbi:MAG: magnesium transporter [Magnetococcales bacterium]|nr:magnesium transporter [Magnetococcales bacterium]
MDEQTETPTPLPEEVLRNAIVENDTQTVQETVNEMPVLDMVQGFRRLEEEEKESVFQLLEPDDAARLLRVIPDVEAAQVVASLSSENAVKILKEYPTHDQAEILQDLTQADSTRLLESMDQENADQLRLIQEYSPDSAGGMMNTETLTFRNGQTVGEVLKILVAEKEKHESEFKFYPYVIDDQRRLVGVLSILRLFGEPSSKTIDSLVAGATHVSTDKSVDELAIIFDETGYFSLPVVDDDGILIGTVFQENISSRRREEAESDALKSQGVIEEELRTMPVFLRSRRRLAWLSANIVLNMIAASVISAYEQTLTAVIAIAVFLPMVSDMSGCSGNQAVAVSMRELALGIVRPADMFRVWIKEISVGLINGIALGILIALVAWVWKGNPYLGLVIGIALALNTMIAVSIGGTVPLLLKRLGVDPAVASGPLLTTVTDMAGFFIVLSLATIMMPWLV